MIALLFQVYATFHIQAHGFNDLDYARGLIRRGVRIFKFDVAPATYESCLRYSSWDPLSEQASRCEDLGMAEHTCCLGMRGDTSGIPHFNQPFNTSDEFVRLLAQEAESFRQSAFIAINFQYDAPLANMTARFWLQLLRAIRQHGLNIILATGSDSFILEYDRLCQEGCSSDQQEISDANIVLQSNQPDPRDKRDYKHRYRNFNTNYNEIGRFCKEGFPGWLDTFH